MKIITRLLLMLMVLLLLTAAAKDAVGIDRYKSMTEKEMFTKADVFRKHDMPDSALLYYTLLLHRYTGDSGNNDAERSLRVAQACIDMGNIYANTYYEYDKAYASFHRAEEIARKYGLESELAECFTDLGVIYYMQDLVENANNFTDTIFSLYKEGFKYAMDSGKREVILSATLNMILSAMDLKKEQSVEKEVSEFMKWSADIKDKETTFVRGVCEVVNCLVSSDVGKGMRSAKLLKETSNGNSYYTLLYHDMMSDFNMRLGNPAEALAHLDSVMMLDDFQYDDKWLTMQIARRKSECLERLGDRQGADAQMLAYFKDRESLLNRGNVRDVRNMHFLNEIDEINSDMEKILIQREYHRRWLFIVSGVALLLVFALMLLMLTYRRLRHSYGKLFDQSKRLLETESVTYSSDGEVSAPSNEGSDIGENFLPKSQGLNLSVEQKEKILENIRKCLDNEELICNPNFQIKTLADEIDQRPRVVSQIINELCGCNFTSLLGEARVKCVCRRLLHSKEYRNLTIEAIAEKAGIKSRSHFAVIFKKFTGLTPSEYIRQANNQHP